MAYQCLRLAVAADNGHAEAYNNLAVLELRRGDVERANSLFRTAADLNPHSYEPHYNQASLSHSVSLLPLAYNCETPEFGATWFLHCYALREKNFVAIS